MCTICSRWLHKWILYIHSDFICGYCMFTLTSYVGSISSHWLHTWVLYAHADFIHGYCTLRWVYTWVLFAHIDFMHGYHMLTMTLHVGSVFSHWFYYVGIVALTVYVGLYALIDFIHGYYMLILIPSLGFKIHDIKNYKIFKNFFALNALYARFQKTFKLLPYTAKMKLYSNLLSIFQYYHQVNNKRVVVKYITEKELHRCVL